MRHGNASNFPLQGAGREEEVVTPPLDRERTPLHRRITPTAPVSPLIVEDRR